MSLRRAKAAQRRLEASRARHDTRAWVVTRRERTRRLIELGGLVAKARLDVLANDDRAVIYGAFLALAGRLSGEDRERVLLLWGQRGHDAFETEANHAQEDGKVGALELGSN